MENLFSFYTEGVTYEKRDDGTDGSIVSYESSYLLTIGWVIFRRGSNFQFWEILLLVTVVFSLAVGLASISCQVKKPISHCINLPPPSFQDLTLTTLCSFVVAFFANTVINRYTTVLTNLSQMIGSTRDGLIVFLSALSASVRNVSPEIRAARLERAYNVSTHLIGLWCLVIRIQMMAARGPVKHEQIIESSLFTEDQKEFILNMNGGKPSVFHVCNAIATEIQDAFEDGIFGDEPHKNQANLATMLDTVRRTRGTAAQIVLYTDIQLPFPFIQMITIVCYTFGIQLIVVCASYIADGGSSRSEEGNYFLGFVTLLLYTIVLGGLLRLYSMLENPLGAEAADIPSDTLYKTMKRTMITARYDMFSRLKYEPHSLLPMDPKDSIPIHADSSTATSTSSHGSGSNNDSNGINMVTVTMERNVDQNVTSITQSNPMYNKSHSNVYSQDHVGFNLEEESTVRFSVGMNETSSGGGRESIFRKTARRLDQMKSGGGL